MAKYQKLVQDTQEAAGRITKAYEGKAITVKECCDELEQIVRDLVGAIEGDVYDAGDRLNEVGSMKSLYGKHKNPEAFVAYLRSTILVLCSEAMIFGDCGSDSERADVALNGLTRSFCKEDGPLNANEYCRKLKHVADCYGGLAVSTDETDTVLMIGEMRRALEAGNITGEDFNRGLSKIFGRDLAEFDYTPAETVVCNLGGLSDAYIADYLTLEEFRTEFERIIQRLNALKAGSVSGSFMHICEMLKSALDITDKPEPRLRVVIASLALSVVEQVDDVMQARTQRIAEEHKPYDELAQKHFGMTYDEFCSKREEYDDDLAWTEREHLPSPDLDAMTMKSFGMPHAEYVDKLAIFIEEYKELLARLGTPAEAADDGDVDVDEDEQPAQPQQPEDSDQPAQPSKAAGKVRVAKHREPFDALAQKIFGMPFAEFAAKNNKLYKECTALKDDPDRERKIDALTEAIFGMSREEFDEKYTTFNAEFDRLSALCEDEDEDKDKGKQRTPEQMKALEALAQKYFGMSYGEFASKNARLAEMYTALLGQSDDSPDLDGPTRELFGMSQEEFGEKLTAFNAEYMELPAPDDDGDDQPARSQEKKAADPEEAADALAQKYFGMSYTDYYLMYEAFSEKLFALGGKFGHQQEYDELTKEFFGMSAREYDEKDKALSLELKKLNERYDDDDDDEDEDDGDEQPARSEEKKAADPEEVAEALAQKLFGMSYTEYYLKDNMISEKLLTIGCKELHQQEYDELTREFFGMSAREYDEKSQALSLELKKLTERYDDDDDDDDDDEDDPKSPETVSKDAPRPAGTDDEKDEAAKVTFSPERPPTPQEIFDALERDVVGQKAAKMALAEAVYDHLLHDTIEAESGVRLKKSTVLFLGPTGSGKTLLVESLARALGVPWVIGDATTFTQKGYWGDDADQLIERLLIKTDGDIDLAERGVVFIDEVDKLAACIGADGTQRHHSIAAQQSFLKLIEGCDVYPNTKWDSRALRGFAPQRRSSFSPREEEKERTARQSISTRKMLFILSGAFVGLEDVIARRLKGPARLGFGAGAARSEGVIDPLHPFKNVTQDDLVEFGLLRELVGRVSYIVPFDLLDTDALVKVLTEPKDSVVAQFKARFAHEGVDLCFAPDALRDVAKLAESLGTGARSLAPVLNDLLSPLRAEAASHDHQGTRLLITPEVVAGTEEARFEEMEDIPF